MEKIRLRWEHTKQTVKDIYAQALRQLLLSISYFDVNKPLKENEDKMTLRFNTYLILMKDIEYFVKSATTTWKNIYHLHKPREYPVEV